VTVADDDHSKQDPDELFQILVRARGKRPVNAMDEIQTALELDQLQVEYHIRGGATNYSGKTAPPEGLTGPVLFQAWRVGTMYLAIEGDHLVVKIEGLIDGYAWEDTSFTIVNCSLVNELWPPKSPTPTPSVSEALELPPASQEQSRVITGSMTASEGSDTEEFAGDVDRSAVPSIPPKKEKRRRRGKQERLLKALAQEIYGENLPMLRPNEFQQAIDSRQKNKTLKTELPPHWVASWDVCKNFLEKIGKLRPF
jgi:hypothetical protein